MHGLFLIWRGNLKVGIEFGSIPAAFSKLAPKSLCPKLFAARRPGAKVVPDMEVVKAIFAKDYFDMCQYIGTVASNMTSEVMTLHLSYESLELEGFC
jgi:hypothetical protein